MFRWALSLRVLQCVDPSVGARRVASRMCASTWHLAWIFHKAIIRNLEYRIQDFRFAPKAH